LHFVLPVAVFRAAGWADGWIGWKGIMVLRAAMIKHALNAADIIDCSFLRIAGKGAAVTRARIL
jgi:hypothetical protein